jgi:hypothetical protein
MSEGDTSDSSPAAAKKIKRKRSLRLRNMQSAAQGGGWFWIEKESVDRILIKATGVESGLMIAVYAALCRLSSDRGNAASVTAGMALLAKLSGCSRRSVLRSMAALERVKLIAVRRTRRGRINDENTYFLLSSNSRKTARAPVPEGHDPGVSEALPLVSENGPFSGTELKERNSLKSSLSMKAKTPVANAACLEAQQASRFASKDGLEVQGLGGW